MRRRDVILKLHLISRHKDVKDNEIVNEIANEIHK